MVRPIGNQDTIVTFSPKTEQQYSKLVSEKVISHLERAVRGGPETREIIAARITQMRNEDQSVSRIAAAVDKIFSKL